MKYKYSITTFCLMFLFAGSQAQGLLIKAGSSFKTEGNINLVANGASIVNEGEADLSGCVLYFTGQSNVSFRNTGNSSVSNIMINKGLAEVQLDQDLFVTGSITMLSGNINLHGNDLHLSATSAINDEKEGSRIYDVLNGKIIISVDLNAPLGANPGQLGAIITSAANLGNVTVSRGHIPQQGTGAGTGKGISRYYDITPSNNEGLSAIFRFSYLDAELQGLPEANLQMFSSTNEAGKWTELGSSGRNTTNNFIDLVGINKFTRLTLGSGSIALPVRLDNCTGICQGKQVLLSWHTSLETGNDHFVVERKSSTGVWSPIGEVPAASQSSGIYQFLDQELVADDRLYRLKQVDKNGQYAYSSMVVVKSCNSILFQAMLAPIPAVAATQLYITAPSAYSTVIKLYTVNGTLLIQKKTALIKGRNTIPMDFTGRSAGHFYLVIDKPYGGQETIPFIR